MANKKDSSKINPIRYIGCCGADCPDYPACKIIHGFYSKNGYKYKRYMQSMGHIRKNGYDSFIKATKNWKGAYGKLG